VSNGKCLATFRSIVLPSSPEWRSPRLLLDHEDERTTVRRVYFFST